MAAALLPDSLWVWSNLSYLFHRRDRMADDRVSLLEPVSPVFSLCSEAGFRHGLASSSHHSAGGDAAHRAW